MEKVESDKLSQFAHDVQIGLNSIPKKLSSKYFYNDRGSQIFQKIMEMSSYYLTNSELEILAAQSGDIVKALDYSDDFNIIELGAGDGSKTKKVLKYLDQTSHTIFYRPIDISKEAVDQLEIELENEFDNIEVDPLVGDYFDVLRRMATRVKPALFMFLGSNIGNYEYENARYLLKQICNAMQVGDKVLIGFDLMKNPRIILEAYDDPEGITKDFNINLLIRMNEELEMDFDPDKFEFFPYYNPNNGEMRSGIVSLEHQKVYSKVLDQTFEFMKNEVLHTELSQKYSLKDIENLSNVCGFSVVEHFFDHRNYFCDSLWEKK